MEMRKSALLLIVLFSLVLASTFRFSRVLFQLGLLPALENHRNLPHRLPQFWLPRLGPRKSLAA